MILTDVSVFHFWVEAFNPFSERVTISVTIYVTILL